MSILDRFELLGELSQENRDKLAMFCQERFLQKGETLFREGDEANAMYFLVKGNIEILKLSNGEKLKLGNLLAEDVLGEMALFGEDNKRMASAVAVEDSSLITILSFSIKEITANHPKLLSSIKDIISKRLINNKNMKVDN